MARFGRVSDPVVVFLGLLLAIVPTRSATAQSGVDVPIEQVVFFKSGVSYVEHRGQVSGDTTMTLRFRTEQMKDVLKSLVLQDLGRGTVGTVGYPSKDPLERRLKSFGVDLSEPTGLGPLLNQLRGTPVTLRMPDGPVEGSVVSAERRTGANGASEWVLTVYGEGGLQTVRLDAVRTLSLDDADLQADLRKALGAVAEARDTDTRTVRLRFDGAGSRRVRIGYVVEAPVWKTSYRLLLPDGDGDAQIQGWGIVENQTDADWENVDLTLVSGRPVSFVQDLYTPLYTDRPVVAPQPDSILAPQRYPEGSRPQSAEFDASLDLSRSTELRARSDADGRESGGGETASRIDPTQGVVSQAATAAEGPFFQYRISDISLPRRRSAMLPIVTETVEVERLSIYDPAVHATHPLRGARVKNTTGLHLAAGPVTVLENGSYAGDARLPDVPPGDTRLVSFALHQDLRIDRGARTGDRTIVTGKIVDGVLDLTRKRTSSRTYRLDNEGDADAVVVVEHPRRDQWTLAAPTRGVSAAPETYRLTVEVEAGETRTLTARQERTLEEGRRLSDLDRDQLVVFARNGRLPDDVRTALERAGQLRQAVDSTEQALERTRKTLNETRAEQSRVRRNMESVSDTTAFYDRLFRKLVARENEIESLQEQVDELQDERNRRRDRLSEYLRTLTIN